MDSLCQHLGGGLSCRQWLHHTASVPSGLGECTETLSLGWPALRITLVPRPWAHLVQDPTPPAVPPLEETPASRHAPSCLGPHPGRGLASPTLPHQVHRMACTPFQSTSPEACWTDSAASSCSARTSSGWWWPPCAPPPCRASNQSYSCCKCCWHC